MMYVLELEQWFKNNNQTFMSKNKRSFEKLDYYSIMSTNAFHVAVSTITGLRNETEADSNTRHCKYNFNHNMIP